MSAQLPRGSWGAVCGPRDADNVGPELAAMGPAHEAEYFVQAIINPNVVIERGKGYEAADGSSKMPSFNDTLTVQELLDLVAYLKALRPPPAPPGRSAGRAAMRPIECAPAGPCRDRPPGRELGHRGLSW